MFIFVWTYTCFFCALANESLKKNGLGWGGGGDSSVPTEDTGRTGVCFLLPDLTDSRAEGRASRGSGRRGGILEDDGLSESTLKGRERDTRPGCFLKKKERCVSVPVSLCLTVRITLILLSPGGG